jgi:hypothetical protein
MADGESSSNTGVVAILVIFLIVVMVALFVWRPWQASGTKEINVDVNVPSGSSK